MSSTIDNINATITCKVIELQKIINIYNEYKLEPKDITLLKTCNNDLNELYATYEFGSLDLLKNYYKYMSSSIQSTTKPIDFIENSSKVLSRYDQLDESYSQFIKFIKMENIIGRLARIYTQCKKIYKFYAIDVDELIDAFNKYEFANIEIEQPIKTSQKMVNSVCTCSNTYVIDPKTSELVCHKCGGSDKLYGVIFEDDQFFYQEGQRTKHSKYDPTKHCKFWADRIQGKESVDIPDDVINGVKRCVKRDMIWLECLTCSMIRSYLKELKKTTYNEHVSLIRKKITLVEPTQFTDQELRLLYVCFGRVVQVYNKIKPDKKPNCPYHPFFIYKIIEQIMGKPEDKTRRNDILTSIHLQSRETLIEHDKLWENICKYLPEFTYMPTNAFN